MEQMYQKLEENHFDIFHQEKKILTKEEVLNLFYKYRNAPFYPDIQEHMMTSESIVLLLVNKVDTIPAEEEGEEDLSPLSVAEGERVVLDWLHLHFQGKLSCENLQFESTNRVGKGIQNFEKNLEL